MVPPPPLCSSFALWGAWFATTATQMVTPRCVLTVLMLGLVFVWGLAHCLACTKSIPCLPSASSVQVKWCFVSLLSLSTIWPSRFTRLSISWMPVMSFPWIFWYMVSKWVMPQLTLHKSIAALMLVPPPHLCPFLPQCTLVLCHLLVLSCPLDCLVLKFVGL